MHSEGIDWTKDEVEIKWREEAVQDEPAGPDQKRKQRQRRIHEIEKQILALDEELRRLQSEAFINQDDEFKGEDDASKV